MLGVVVHDDGYVQLAGAPLRGQLGLRQMNSRVKSDGRTHNFRPVIECLLRSGRSRSLPDEGAAAAEGVTAPVRFNGGVGRRSGTLCFDHPRSLFPVAPRRSMVCPTSSRPMRVTAP
jgi:hypothetical protein